MELEPSPLTHTGGGGGWAATAGIGRLQEERRGVREGRIMVEKEEGGEIREEECGNMCH